MQKEKEVEEDEAREAGGGASEPRTAGRCVLLCRINYEAT